MERGLVKPPGGRSCTLTALGTGSLDYRPEIDGLRAVAILTVLLFHLDVAPFSGGYVGVDVFFVISGYLITRILLRDLDAGRLSLQRFYGGRVRRLFPALVVTLALTLAAGYLLLNPQSLMATALDALYATISLGNVHFAATNSYFDEAAGLKPLLHTWSLGVEEQFYLFWPLLIARFGGRRRWLLITIGLLGLASLAASELALQRAPVAGFFWMPFRIWELGLGALLTWVPRSDGVTRGVRELVLAAGLLAILYASVTFDGHTMFPGLNALLPCVGSACCIWAGDTPSLGALLRNRLSVGVGKLSYSLYLMHWPLIVFAKQTLPRALTPLDQVVLAAGSFALAWGLHSQVERRFRYKKEGAPRHRFAIGVAAFTLAACVFAHQLRARDGVPTRYPASFRALIAQGDRVTPEEAAAWREGRCFLNSGKGHAFDRFDRDMCLTLDPDRDNVLIFGDSAAAQLFHGLATVHGERVQFLQATAASCRGHRIEEDATCRDMFAFVLDEWLPAHGARLDAIVLGARWDDVALFPWIEALVAKLRVRQTPVVLVGPPVDHDTAIATLIASRYGPLTAGAASDEEVAAFVVPRENLRVHVPLMEREMRRLAERIGVSYLSLLAPQCGEAGCLATVKDGDERVLIQRDKFHYTMAGSRWLASQLSLRQLKGGGS